MNTTTEAKPWPENWLPRELYLSAVGEAGGGINTILKRAEPMAAALGRPINFGYCNNAVKRLAKEGALTVADGIYRINKEPPALAVAETRSAPAPGIGAFVGALRAELVEGEGYEPEYAHEVCARVVARLSSAAAAPIPACVASITEPAEPEAPPLSAREQWEIAWAALPTSADTAITEHEWLARTESKGVTADAITSWTRYGRQGHDLGLTRIPSPDGLRLWRDTAAKPPTPKPMRPSMEPVFSPPSPETDQEREARRERQERIRRNMEPDDVAELAP